MMHDEPASVVSACLPLNPRGQPRGLVVVMYQDLNMTPTATNTIETSLESPEDETWMKQLPNT